MQSQERTIDLKLSFENNQTSLRKGDKIFIQYIDKEAILLSPIRGLTSMYFEWASGRDNKIEFSSKKEILFFLECFSALSGLSLLPIREESGITIYEIQ